MRLRFAVLPAALCLAALATPSFAHHSSAAYDTTKVVHFKGTVTGVDFRNPHVRIHLDVADAAGHIVNWDVETWGTGQLALRGLTNGFLKPHDHVTTDVFLMKDGSARAFVRTLTLPDGRTMDGPPVDLPSTR